MKILVNATTLVVGGGIQIGVSFIQQAIKETRFEWRFLVSEGIYNEISPEIKKRYCLVCFPDSPAKLLKGRASRKKILSICESWNPVLIYSIGFPSYIQFNQPEIGRYTNPWEINEKPLPWHLYPRLFDRLKIQLGIWYRQKWARRASYIETQTEAAKIGIVKRVGFPDSKIKVIPNSPNEIFIKAAEDIAEKTINPGIFNILCLAAPYPHKNLLFIPEVAFELKEKYGLEPIFMLTIPEEDLLLTKIKNKSDELGVTSQINNLGKLNLQDCLEYYKISDLVFLPTLMEIFSATYLEAMAMRVPILTSDLSFARDNCGEAALYFKHDSVEDASSKLNSLFLSSKIRKDLIEKGKKKLKEYPSNQEKYKTLFDWFEQVITNKK